MSRDNRKLLSSILPTLRILCACDHCFTVHELEKHGVSENALHFFTEIIGCRYHISHIPGTECIALMDKNERYNWVDCIKSIAHNLPAVLSPEEQHNIVNTISSSLTELGYEIPESIVMSTAFREYASHGSILIKTSLNMGDKYEIVLDKFFSEGLRLYQHKNMTLFRKKYYDLFGDDIISDNDRAIIARLTDRCILIDRGTYIRNRNIDLPTELLQNILDFIAEYPFDRVMTNVIMHKFNIELNEIGICNKYYLSAILRKYFVDKFTFNRDYVIKDVNSLSFHSNITGFVEKFRKGMSFHDLQAHFQGVPDAVLYFALSEDDNIIPMYNKTYIHKNNIIFPEQQSILSFLKELISKENIVADKHILKLLIQSYPDFIARNNVNSSWFLFSLLRSFFSEEFIFSRPHIIDIEFDLTNGYEALKSYFWGKKYIKLTEIKNYAKEKQIHIYDFLKLLDSYSDKYFILDKETLICIEEIGYSLCDFVYIEDLVVKELADQEYVEIKKLNISNALPKSNVTITEWLIYSIINKYGTRLAATTTSRRFINSVPIVARNNIYAEAIRGDFTDQAIAIEDLSDIEELLEESNNLDS